MAQSSEQWDPSRSWPEVVGHRTDLRDRLLAAYAEPHRHYHGTRHLAEVLTHVHQLAAANTGPGVAEDAILLAAWFHDAVYDPRADPGRNEEASARLAERELDAAGCERALVAEVARLVRLTADHRPEPGDAAGEVLIDADLAILGSPPGRYDEYAAAVRREYAHVPDDQFRAARADILRGLASGASVFHTAGARARWEASAHANVARELAALSP